MALGLVISRDESDESLYYISKHYERGNAEKLYGLWAVETFLRGVMFAKNVRPKTDVITMEPHIWIERDSTDAQNEQTTQ